MVPRQHHQPGFPPCVSLRIEFNQHANNYDTVEQWLADAEVDPWFSWVSEDERAKAIASDSVWICQWYPDTPIGFSGLAASSFDVLMAAVNEDQDAIG